MIASGRAPEVLRQLAQGQEIARGLVNYASAEARLIAGKASQDIESVLGFIEEPELIHRDNLVVVG